MNFRPLRTRQQITLTSARLGLGALRRWQWLVWLATRHHFHLAFHPNPAAVGQSCLLTSPYQSQIAFQNAYCRTDLTNPERSGFATMYRATASTDSSFRSA